MVGTITPIVHRGTRQRLWQLRLVLIVFAIATLIGSVLAGLAIAAVGGLLFSDDSVMPRSMIIAVSAAVFAVAELRARPLSLPQSRWQVCRSWMTLRPFVVGPALFGLCLGTGVLTRIPVSSFYVLVAWALLSGQGSFGAAAMVWFGVGRVLPLIILLAADTHTLQLADGMLQRDALVHSWKPAVHVVNGLCLSAVAGYWITFSFPR